MIQSLKEIIGIKREDFVPLVSFENGVFDQIDVVGVVGKVRDYSPDHV